MLLANSDRPSTDQLTYSKENKISAEEMGFLCKFCGSRAHVLAFSNGDDLRVRQAAISLFAHLKNIKLY